MRLYVRILNPISFFALDAKDFPEKLVNSQSGELLIVGSGRCVWDDVRGLPEFSQVMCVNDMGMYWPGPVRHWYSNDVEQLVHWNEGRRRTYTQQFGTVGRLHSCFARSHLSNVHHWPFPGQGSSGLLAIIVALTMGYAPITTAGLPFDNSGHFYDPPNDHNLSKGRPWSNFKNETPDRLIVRSLPLLEGRVIPLSGRLREALRG